MKYPTYWLTIIFLLLILGSVCTAQIDPNNIFFSRADINFDGRVDLVDFALFVGAYQSSAGSIPLAYSDTDRQRMMIENEFLRMEVLRLEGLLSSERIDVLRLKQWLDQQRLKYLSSMEGLYRKIDSMRQPLNVYLYDVSGIDGVHITFGDPNSISRKR